MKTYLIDLTDLNNDQCKELLGFALTVGLNFRKVSNKEQGKTLFLEVESIREETSLKKLLTQLSIQDNTFINNKDNSVLKNFKRIGFFKKVEDDEIFTYKQNKFSIVK